MEKWVCNLDETHVYKQVTKTGFCEKCEGILIKKETPGPIPPPDKEDIYDGDHGVGIFVFDLSGSMSDLTDPQSDSPLTKIQQVARAFSSTITTLLYGGGKELTAISQPDNYFLAIIGFSERAELFTINPLADMKQNNREMTFQYWENWILEKFEDFGNLTNITAGLEKARIIYDIALAKEPNRSDLMQNLPDNIKEYEDVLKKLDLNSQSITAGESMFRIPNIRVLIYSDGEHNVGELKNPFKDRYLKAGLKSSEGTPTNGVMSIYFGSASDPGAEQMRSIAGYCPQHGGVGYIPISKLEHDKYLRDLLHLTSKATGFCLLCSNHKL